MILVFYSADNANSVLRNKIQSILFTLSTDINEIWIRAVKHSPYKFISLDIFQLLLIIVVIDTRFGGFPACSLLTTTTTLSAFLPLLQRLKCL